MAATPNNSFGARWFGETCSQDTLIEQVSHPSKYRWRYHNVGNVAYTWIIFHDMHLWGKINDAAPHEVLDNKKFMDCGWRFASRLARACKSSAWIRWQTIIRQGLTCWIIVRFVQLDTFQVCTVCNFTWTHLRFTQSFTFFSTLEWVGIPITLFTMKVQVSIVKHCKYEEQ